MPLPPAARCFAPRPEPGSHPGKRPLRPRPFLRWKRASPIWSGCTPTTARPSSPPSTGSRPTGTRCARCSTGSARVPMHPRRLRELSAAYAPLSSAIAGFISRESVDAASRPRGRRWPPEERTTWSIVAAVLVLAAAAAALVWFGRRAVRRAVEPGARPGRVRRHASVRQGRGRDASAAAAAPRAQHHRQRCRCAQPEQQREPARGDDRAAGGLPTRGEPADRRPAVVPGDQVRAPA